MSSLLIIVGVLLIIAGAVVFLLPTTTATTAERSLDIGKVLEELNKLLDKFDKRYRPGIILMVVGLSLVGIGAWLEARDAHDATQTSAVVIVQTPSRV
ncbi:MAG: hypothetical protein ACR2MO_06115 [Acidimicrobiales bacterium]